MATPETKPLDLRALPPDLFLSERQLADATGESAAFYRKQRHRGKGPKFVQLGERKIRYRVRDVLEWLDGLQTFSNMETNPAGITPQRRKMLSKAGKTSSRNRTKGKPERRAAAV